MKKWKVLAVTLVLLLSGCGAAETMETISDDLVAPAAVASHQISLVLPSQAASPTVESDSDRLYQCETYDIRVQTLPGGDLNESVRTVSGYEKDSLTIMHKEKDGFDCYEFAWASAGEAGDQVGRAMLLDDGSFHYCVSVLGQAAWSRENQVYWQELFDSFTLN